MYTESIWTVLSVCARVRVLYLSNFNSRQSLCISLSQVQLVLRHVELLHLIGSVYRYNVLKEDNQLLEKVGMCFLFHVETLTSLTTMTKYLASVAISSLH